MNRSIIISSVSHLVLIMITAFSLPFLAKKPIDLPPIVSVELIQITDKTNIPYAPKAKKIIEKIKEKEKKLVKSKVESAETIKKNNKITQDQKKNVENAGLSLSEEDALKAQIFGCWSIPLGLPYNENLLVRIKLQLNPDGTIQESEILDHARMNKPGQGFYKVLAESALRAIKLCQPLRVPTTGYERWKELQLNFDAREMLEG